MVGSIRHATKELSADRIRTNGIAPGVVMTPLIAGTFDVPQEKATELTHHIDEQLGPQQALGRYGTVDDIAAAALFLASDLRPTSAAPSSRSTGGISSYTLRSSDEDIARTAQDFLAEVG